MPSRWTSGASSSRAKALMPSIRRTAFSLGLIIYCLRSDPTFAVLPVRFADQAAYDLAIGVLRQLLDEVHRARLLEAGQRSAAMLDDFLGAQALAWFEHHHRAD